jgi:hypothetical protein
MALYNEGMDPTTGEIGFNHPLALAIRANATDTPTYRDYLRMDSHERDPWDDAMELEMNQLFAKDTFKIVDRKLAVGRVLDCIWVLRLKRLPDGTVSKHKARFCVRGDQQAKQDKNETYAPVVEWSTIRLMFVLTQACGLQTRQIDFRNAFVQSALPEPIYVELPPSYRKEFPTKVLQVKKSLYGDRRAPRLWFEHVTTKLVDPNGPYQFHQSAIDSCLFLRNDCAFILYVDDGIFFSKDDQVMDAILTQLGKDFDVEVQGDFAGYLGVEIDAQPDGSLHLKQTGLIDRILDALGLDKDSTAKDTPATETLGRDEHGSPCVGDFNYRSVNGMLMYLSGTTRSDISFANHQCARFANDPKLSHEKAMKRIGRYLKGTRNKGMIIKPTGKLTMDCYADADFAGLWNYEDLHDPTCVRSRTGYLLTLGGIPVVWASKLQTEIALSTMESEYIALSTSMRVLIPLRYVLEEVANTLDLDYDSSSTMSTVWEDNQAALILATTNPPRLTPRSKHIAIKYHWFRSHLAPGQIEVKAIASEDQKADMFTKALKRELFAKMRKLVLGW